MSKPPLFQPGQFVMTKGVVDTGITADRVTDLLRRHLTGDFGVMDAHDVRENLISIEHGYRIMSAYHLEDDDPDSTKLWIITESDRSVTTMLLPDEY